MKFQTILLVIEVGGTLAFAMSGLLEAIRKRMDIVGVFSVAFVSAFGGGTLRDILLDRRPLFWIENQEYLWLVLAMVATTPLWLQTLRHKVGGRLMELADALGLGLFAISGATLADAAGMPALVSMMMGVVTAVFGGVSRDVLCNEVPRFTATTAPTRCARCSAAASSSPSTRPACRCRSPPWPASPPPPARACSPSSSTCACRRGRRTATERGALADATYQFDSRSAVAVMRWIDRSAPLNSSS